VALGGVVLVLHSGVEPLAPGTTGVAATRSATTRGAALPTDGDVRSEDARDTQTARPSGAASAERRPDPIRTPENAPRFVLKGTVSPAKAGVRIKVATFVEVPWSGWTRLMTVYGDRFEEVLARDAGLTLDDRLTVTAAAYEHARFVPLASGITAEDGSFAIPIPRTPDLPALESLHVTALSEDSVAVSHRTSKPAPDDDGVYVWPERIGLAKVRRLEVAVRGAGPGARVLVYEKTPATGWWHNIDNMDEVVPSVSARTTDAAGRLVLETAAVEAVVEIWKPGFAAVRRRLILGQSSRHALTPRDEKRLRAYTRTQDDPVRLDVDLGPEARLEGVVRDAKGAPVVGAYLELNDDDPLCPTEIADGSTDAQGRFAFPGLVPGQLHWLRVSSPGGLFHSADRLFTPPNTAADIVLAAGKLVVDAKADGERADVWTILERRFDDGTWERDRHLGDGVTTEDGLVFDGIAPGTVRLIVWKSGLAPAVSEPIVVGDTGEPNKVSFALDEGRTVTGRIVDAEGRGVSSQVQYEVDSCPGLSEIVFTSTGDGEFRLRNVPRGAGRLRVGPPRNPSSVVVELPEGRTDVGDVRLPSR
jgi:hypothetical protein